MKIGILGSGPSALYSALFLLKKHPDWEVEIFEKEEKLAKKLRATGNGRANLLPAPFDVTAYNDRPFMEALSNRFSIENAVYKLADLGIYLAQFDGPGIYPISNSANIFADLLLSIIEKLGGRFHTGKRVLGYRVKGGQAFLSFEGGKEIPFDKLILAPGAASGKNLGSDGSFLDVLIKHGYQVSPFRPGLCPVRCLDKDLRPLSGIRHKANVTLYQNDRAIFEERGELLYKDDGISGIVIMNASSAIARRKMKGHFLFEIDLFPDLQAEALGNAFDRLKYLYGGSPLVGFFPKALADHIERRAKREIHWTLGRSLAESSKHLRYEYLENYPFAYSQVSVGGLSLSEIGKNFESKREKSVYFLGEILDIDGNCGGYNLYFDLIAALALVESL